jgi:methylation protein EvaC
MTGAAVRDECAGCGGDLEIILDLGETPLADRFPAPGGQPEIWYRLRAAVCTRCWLMQLADLVPDGELFGADYAFQTSMSPSAAAHFETVAARLLRRHGTGGLVAEIGCNDGTLLQHFAKAGCATLGIDPAGPAVTAAAARGLAVVPELFTADLAARIRPGASLVLAFNVAAHVADPHDFLAGVREMLAPGGTAVVEFQYAGDLVAACQYDNVYHEHRFFYTAGSFGRLAARAGLQVTETEHTGAQGGSMQVTLRRGGAPDARLPRDETWLRQFTPYAGLQERARYARDRLRALLEAEAAHGAVVAGYGATAKSATLLNYCGIRPGLARWVEDLTPGKTGRLTPGTRIPVVRPGERGVPDAYLLLAWNYLGGVLRREAAFIRGGGRFIVPGPVPVTA